MLDHFRMLEVDVIIHKIVIVTVLVVNERVVSPTFIIPLNQINTGSVTASVIVGPCKVIPVPGEIIVGFLATIKGEASPTLNFEGFRNGFLTIVRIHLNDRKAFLVVGAGLVVEDDISDGVNPVGFQGFNQIEIVVFCSVFSRDGPLLVEFSQVKQVIDAIADVVFVGAFEGRREPDFPNALGSQFWS